MMEDLRRLSVSELQKLWEQKRDEALLLRRELDRRTGKDVKPSVEIDYDKYVTK